MSCKNDTLNINAPFCWVLSIGTRSQKRGKRTFGSIRNKCLRTSSCWVDCLAGSLCMCARAVFFDKDYTNQEWCHCFHCCCLHTLCVRRETLHGIARHETRTVNMLALFMIEAFMCMICTTYDKVRENVFTQSVYIDTITRHKRTLHWQLDLAVASYPCELSPNQLPRSNPVHKS